MEDFLSTMREEREEIDKKREADKVSITKINIEQQKVENGFFEAAIKRNSGGDGEVGYGTSRKLKAIRVSVHADVSCDM